VKPQNTADLVALILAGIVAITVVGTVAALLFIELRSPDQDTSGAADAISRITSVLVAALVGFMAGRKVNGNH
jgi:hypothetical protein